LFVNKRVNGIERMPVPCNKVRLDDDTDSIFADTDYGRDVTNSFREMGMRSENEKRNHALGYR
jgi:hypothetical protein